MAVYLVNDVSRQRRRRRRQWSRRINSDLFYVSRSKITLLSHWSSNTSDFKAIIMRERLKT